MKKLIVFLILLQVGIVQADVVKVSSGEHDGFTRIVFELSQPMNWQVGRTADGYEVRFDQPGLEFDLASVFDLIGRSRLASIRFDDATASLRIGIGCACYAQPFEFRPGIVVLDLRDGLPPAASSFESALPGIRPLTGVPSVVSPSAHRNVQKDSDLLPMLLAATKEDMPLATETRGQKKAGLTDPWALERYDWRHAVRETMTATDQYYFAAKMESPLSNRSLGPLRDALIRHLAQGVAAGVVNAVQTLPAVPASNEKNTDATENLTVAVNVPGAQVVVKTLPTDAVGADGEACIADARLDIAAWGDDRAVAEQMADAFAGLAGEFDRQEYEATTRAVRFLLFIGFGAEARQMLQAMPIDHPDTGIWQSMARLIDDGFDPESPMRGMLACDGAAALWAALSIEQLEKGLTFSGPGIARSFSALPSHLRRHIGPTLANRFLDIGEVETARAIRDATARIPGKANPSAALLDAQFQIQAGNGAAAEKALLPLVSDPGPGTSEALIAVIDARATTLGEVDAETVLAIAALLAEARGGVDEARIARALALAYALSGDFVKAFADPTKAGQSGSILWQALAFKGSDDALLAHGILQRDGPVPDVPDATRQKLAERLLGFGFAEPALVWLEAMEAPDLIMAATADLAKRDATSALHRLSGLTSEDAKALRAKAHLQLDDLASASAAFADNNDAAGVQRVQRLAYDWSTLAATGDGPWQAAAGMVTTDASPDVQTRETAVVATNSNRLEPGLPGTLARGNSLLTSSAATRDAIGKLLASVNGQNQP